MNKSYIDALIKHRRVGSLIKQIKDNEHNWSVDDLQYVFDECITHKLYVVFHFMLEIFNKKDCISFIDNNKFQHSFDICNINKVFMSACENGHKEIVEYLLSPSIQERYPQIDPSAQKNFGFILACRNGHKEIVEYLLSVGIQERYPNIDPSAQNNLGLWACKNGHKNIVEYLLSAGIQKRFPKIDPSVSDNYGFRNACFNGHKEIVKYLLSKDIQERYPQICISKLKPELIENIEKCIGYSIQ